MEDTKGVYKHFKGERVRVLGICKHSETLEEFVCYVHLDTEEMWVRPREMFFEVIQRDGKQIARFEKEE